MKKTYKLLLVTVFCLSLDAQDRWTIGVSSTTTLKNAQAFVDKNSDKFKNSLSINKIDENKYHVNYGLFNNYYKSKKALGKIDISGAYIRKINIRDTNKKALKAWTIGLATTSSLKSADNFVNKIPKNYKKNISIEKIRDNRYFVNYKSYNTYKETKNALLKLLQEHCFNGAYIRKTKNISSKDRSNNERSYRVEEVYVNDLLPYDNSYEEQMNIDDEDYQNSNISQVTLEQQINSQTSLENKKSYLPMLKTNNEQISTKEQNNDLIYHKIDLNIKDIKPLDDSAPVSYRKEDDFKQDEIIYIPKDLQRIYLNNDIFDQKNYKTAGIKLKYFPSSLSGEFKFGTSSSTIDFNSDLNLNKTINGFTPSVFYKQGKHKGYLNYTPLNSTVSSTLNSNIIVDNYTYTANDNITTKVDSTIFNAGYRYNIYDFDIGADFYNLSKNITVADNQNKTDIDLDYNIYALGIEKEHNFNNKYILSYGLKYGAGENISLIDYYLSGGLKGIMLKNSLISFGYQSKTFDIEDSVYKGETTYDGPFINIQYFKEF
ncbi:MAG: hypothetical protein U9Q33_02645 [Campylobacterota bacterium]|nr:hypothetical protein [Campylobacterota bacterium]